MTGTVLTSVLGLVFWVFAARLYDTSYFGVNATAIYTMTMLADVACLGFRTGVVRFLPKAGRRTAKTIVISYGLVLAASAATGAVFLIGLHRWAPRLLELRSSMLLFAFFVCSTSFWAIFMLQDGVLVGLRKAPWVPVENTLFGVLKIVLLFPFASLSPTLGIFWAWTLPVFPIVIGINLMIARLVPAHAIESSADGDEPDRDLPLVREILSFSFADWLGSVARLAALGIIPLMVLAALDETETGYFQAGWLIAFAVFSLSSNVAYALLAENSYEEHKLRRNSMQAVFLTLGLTVPIVIVGGLGASLILRIYGVDFAANSAWVLRLLLLAAVPNAIYQIFTGRLRSESKMVAVVVVESLLAAMVVTMAWLFLPRFGIEGVGLAWLIGLGILAAYAVANESQWWWVSRIDTRLVRGAGSVVRRIRAARPGRQMSGRLAGVMETVGGAGAAVQWTPGDDDFQTATVALPDGRAMEVDFARSAAGAAELERVSGAIARLQADPRMAEIHDLLPRLEARDRTEGREYSAWWAPVGPTALELVESGVSVEVLAAAGLAKLRPLHQATAATVLIDDDLVNSWIEGPLARLATAGRASPGHVEQLRRCLTAGFADRPAVLGQIHGGLSLDNIVMRSASEPTEVIGFARWERTTSNMPIAMDRAMLTLSDLYRRQGGELGHVVRGLLDDPSDFEQHLIMANGGPSPDSSDWSSADDSTSSSRALILLAWLHFVGQPQSQRTVTGEAFWLARNAQPVLATFDGRVEMRS